MPLDAGFVIRTGSGFALALVGLGMVLLRPRGAEARAWSWGTLGWGVGVIAFNSAGIGPDWAVPGVVAGIVGYSTTIFAYGGLILLLARRASRRNALVAWGALALLAAALVPDVVNEVTSPAIVGTEVAVPSRALTVAASLAGQFGGVLLFAGVLLFLALAEGASLRVFPALGLVVPVALLARGDRAWDAMWFSRELPGIAALAAISFFALRNARLWRIVHVGLATMLTLMILRVTLPSDALAGTFGITRIICAAGIAYAVIRHDLLDVTLPTVVFKSGALATTALAALFIVAQVAQNFLSDSYGLLMGGVVAGAMLFAATPIQRAMERANAPAAPATSRRDEVYLNAVRLALRDRRLSREEESHLHRLAEELGIGAGRAHELLVQAEEEAGVT